jgi:hypothetical protein
MMMETDFGGVCQDETVSTVFGMTSTEIIHGRIDFNLPSVSGRLQALIQLTGSGTSTFFNPRC